MSTCHYFIFYVTFLNNFSNNLTHQAPSVDVNSGMCFCCVITVHVSLVATITVINPSYFINYLVYCGKLYSYLTRCLAGVAMAFLSFPISMH